MQFVEGETLRQTIGGRPMSLESLLSISLQVADGLAAAHAHGIIHREIKSGNIIAARGQAKVLDFGLAKLLERDGGEAGTDMTLSGAVIGTPASMSPEQARNEQVDHRSDIFSFGVVMYEMATGRTPFDGKTRADVISALLRETQTPAADLNSEIPARMSGLINRALAKEPADRYQSIPEMVVDLRRVVSDGGGLMHFSTLSEAPRCRAPVPFRRPALLGTFRAAGFKIERQSFWGHGGDNRRSGVGNLLLKTRTTAAGQADQINRGASVQAVNSRKQR
jgi:serine/threonine protein kinase